MAKHILALANSGGDELIVGVSQEENGDIETPGLTEFLDKAEIAKTVKNYVPSNVIYEVFDFPYNSSEYDSIRGKKFQVLLVEYSEEILPLLAIKAGNNIKANVAYIRSGTESTEANHQQLEHLLNLRIESGYSSSHTLELAEHLEQLKTLYNARKLSRRGLLASALLMENFIGGNSLSEYYSFVEEMIDDKKKRIRKELETSPLTIRSSRARWSLGRPKRCAYLAAPVRGVQAVEKPLHL